MRILFLGGSTRSLFHFRGKLMEELKNKGHEIFCSAPHDEFSSDLIEKGFNFEKIEFNTSNLNPFNEIRLYLKYKRHIKKINPNILFTYTIKPVIYGSFAVPRLSRIKIFSMITGLSYGFNERGFKSFIARFISKMFYRISLKKSNKIFFQNNDDKNAFIKWRLVKKEKSVLINGSGVDLNYYQAQDLPENNVFLMLARLMKSKGIVEYCKAAEIVKEKYKNTIFILQGRQDPNPENIGTKAIKSYIENDTIQYREWVPDVREVLKKSRFYVLPSYHEGTPRSTLEAMATGRPVITTDVPGCRETVQDGYNGFLIPIKDYKILAEKMMWMIENKEAVNIMAKNSILVANEKYDVIKVNDKIISIMGL